METIRSAGTRQQLPRHGLIAILAWIGLAIVGGAATPALADVTAERPARDRSATGWRVAPDEDINARVSSHSVDEFARLTGTRTPVESATPLTDEEMAWVASDGSAGAAEMPGTGWGLPLGREAKGVSVPISASGVETTDAAAAALAAQAVPAPGPFRQRRGYDDFTLAECQARDVPDQLREWVTFGKNHFAWCAVGIKVYGFGKEFQTTFRVTVLGRGVRGSQRMNFELRLDQFQVDPLFKPLPPGTPLTVRLNCLPSANGVCESSSPNGRTDTIAGWMQNGTYLVQFDTSDSPGGGDLMHFDRDKVSYHDLQIMLIGEGGVIDQFVQPFRCDAAPYASGGGCIFHEVQSVLHYRLNSPQAAVAEHIQFAQDHPDQTFPNFGIGTIIPGKPGTIPLTRLHRSRLYKDARLPGGAEDGLTYYRKNRALVSRQCARLGLEPSERRGLECDEYPFASTYEGAHFTELNPGSAQKYSVRYVNGTQNGSAGGILGTWYTVDHILARDPFYVQIDP